MDTIFQSYVKQIVTIGGPVIDASNLTKLLYDWLYHLSV